MGRGPLSPWAPGLQVPSLSVHRTALDLGRMRRELGRIRLAGATWQRLRSSRPRGRRVWPDENKAGVRGDCQTGGAKTIAIKGTWRRTAAQSCLGVRLSWDGSRLRLQTPNPPGPGPRRDTRKNPGSAALPWMLCKYPERPHTAEGSRDTRGLGQQLPARKTCRRALLPLPFRGLPGSPRRAARWLCPPPLPPSPRADSRSRLSEPRPRAPGPAPGRQAPPLHAGLQPQGTRLARWGLHACSGDEAAAAAPAATTAVFATAAKAPHRPKRPELTRGTLHHRGLEMLARTGQVWSMHLQHQHRPELTLHVMQISELHPRPTESEYVGVGPSIDIFTSSWGDFKYTEVGEALLFCSRTKGLADQMQI